MSSSTNSVLREVILVDDRDSERLLGLIVATYKNFSALTAKLHPFLHKNIDNEQFSFSPMWVMENVKNNGTPEMMFAGFAASVTEFVRKNKCLKRLPEVNVKTHRSFQLTDKFFNLQKVDVKEYVNNQKHRKVNNVRTVHKLTISRLGIEMYVENLVHDKYHHMVMRPKFVRNGTDRGAWEIIMYPQKTEYMIEHID